MLDRHWSSLQAAPQAVDQWIAAAVSATDTQVVSLLFPWVTQGQDAVNVIRDLCRREGFWLEADEVRGDRQHLHLRFSIESAPPVDAWVMAFAPFDWMPNTRRAPYFELAMRVKPKPDWIFHRLNQDRALAHLADVEMDMSDQHWEDRWRSTLRRTRMILGGEPDEVSAAKATLAVPVRAEDASPIVSEDGSQRDRDSAGEVRQGCPNAGAPIA